MYRVIKSSENLDFELESIYGMALINPPLTKQCCVKVRLMDGGEGANVPHVHVYLGEERKDNCAYVRLDVPEYSDYHGESAPSLRMNKKQKADFIKLMSEIWKKQFIQSITDESKIRNATGYEYAVVTWVDAYGDPPEGSKFTYDDEGFPVMPDYSKL